MALDVDLFIQTMLGNDQKQLYTALKTFQETNLTLEEKKTLHKRVNHLYLITTKADAHHAAVLFLYGLVNVDFMGHRINEAKAVLALKEAVDLEHAAAMLLLADIYIKEAGVTKTSQQLLAHAIALGNPMAMLRQAQLYLHVKKYAEAIPLLDAAIQQNNSQAMVLKAELLESKKLGQPDILGAIDLYYQAVAENNVDAMIGLSSLFVGTGGHVDQEEAVMLLTKAAQLDNAFALNNLAYMYEYGEGCKVDVEAAKILYDRAIRLGDLDAAFNKACLLITEKNYPEAISLLDRGVRGVDPDAMLKRAWLHEQGLGGKVNLKEADRLYEEAYILNRKSDIPRRVKIKLLIDNKQYNEVLPLCMEGIAQNETQAMIDLARVHLQGGIGPINHVEGIKWLNKAIELGSPEAMYQLALLQEQGYFGYKPNPQAAQKLYEQAIALGHLPSMEKASQYFKNQSGLYSAVKFRVLYLMSSPKDFIERRSHEDYGFYQTLCNGFNHLITTDSVYSLGLALAYLKTLPATLPQVINLKKTIFMAVEKQIIPQYPVNADFHSKTAHLNGKTIDAIMFLIDQYAMTHYSEAGRTEVAQAFDYKLLAQSKDPKVLHTLKALAKVFPKLFYWVGMSYLNTNRPGGFFTSSGQQEAMEWFKKAAGPLNHDKETKELAKQQLLLAERGAAPGIVMTEQSPPPAYPTQPLFDKSPDPQQYLAPEQKAAPATLVKMAPKPAAQPPAVYPPILYPVVPLVDPFGELTPEEKGKVMEFA